MQQLDPHEVLLVVGIRRAGKSTYCRKLAQKQRRVIVWDPYGEYETREQCTLDELIADPDRLDRESLSLSVVPSWRTPEELSEQFAIFADLGPSLEPGTALIIEECALIKRAAGSLIFLATQSGHWGVPLVLVAQRAVSIHKDAREQCSSVVSFRQSSPDDINALVERCGQGALKVGQLPRFEFWAWDESQAFDNKPDGQEQKQ